eukprot:g47935.t1
MEHHTPSVTYKHMVECGIETLRLGHVESQVCCRGERLGSGRCCWIGSFYGGLFSVGLDFDDLSDSELLKALASAESSRPNNINKHLRLEARALLKG